MKILRSFNLSNDPFNSFCDPQNDFFDHLIYQMTQKKNYMTILAF